MTSERSSLLPETTTPERGKTSLTDLFESPTPDAQFRPYESTTIQLVPLKGGQSPSSARHKCCSCTVSDITSTVIGSITFLLYHVVFCLAQAATITRPRADHSSTGLLAKTAALGIILAGPVFIYELGNQIPAIYPASDLFLAPFLAQVAVEIDQVLYQHGLANDDVIFLATFSAVTGFGLLLSGTLCVIAARVKLANLGSFLPYSVLCGFFTTIGILMWTLGFNVDTGLKVGQVLFSGDPQVVTTALIHHMPSVAIGVVMHILGPKNPFWVLFLIFCTVAGSYFVMWLTDTTLEQAQNMHWFFSPTDLVSTDDDGNEPSIHSIAAMWDDYGPPLPFGVWVAALRGEIFWEAAQASVPTVLALAFLYLIRCSLHSAALKKNIPNVTRAVPDAPSPLVNQLDSATVAATSESSAKKEPLTLGFILEHGYGYSQLVAAVSGGIAVAPSVAASLTLFKLGAEAKAPQYGSCVLLLLFYWTDFRLVQYIPKPAFSCLMVLAGLDMIKTWVVGSYMKTQAKLEWMVAPVLVVLAFSVGMLNAIGLGIAISTFIFVANFYRAGTVKFVGSGLTLRSTVERGLPEVRWLDQHADLIQILVLQNYLFFGNAQSYLTYIQTMFEEPVASPTSGPLDYPLPPVPKVLIVDFTFVNGMDTSAVDLFREIVSLCKEHKCRLFLAGLNPNLKSMLIYAGVTPDSKRFSYTRDLETALAKAEDSLITNVFHLNEKDELETSIRRKVRSRSQGDDGFLYALEKIDEQHGLNTKEELRDLGKLAVPIELEHGEVLFREDSDDHGLYFVETGLMRVEHSSNYTTTGISSRATSYSGHDTDPTVSIGHLNARAGSLGRSISLWKEEETRTQLNEQSFRLARFGAGWVIGSIEAAAGMRRPGEHVAISDCRLHHLSHSAIKEVEKTNPTLSMNLYKLLSYLSTKRQEMTIRQLAQFVHILNAPTPRLRGGKNELAKLQGLQAL